MCGECGGSLPQNKSSLTHQSSCEASTFLINPQGDDFTYAAEHPTDLSHGNQVVLLTNGLFHPNVWVYIERGSCPRLSHARCCCGCATATQSRATHVESPWLELNKQGVVQLPIPACSQLENSKKVNVEVSLFTLASLTPTPPFSFFGSSIRLLSSSAQL